MSAPRHAGSELGALLHLRMWPRLGDVRLWRALHEAGSARAALDRRRASDPAGRTGEGDRDAAVGRALAWLERQEDARLFSCLDADYPARLRALHDPPPLLLAQGHLELLEQPAVAVVGTRTPTEYGRDVAHTLGRDLAAAGVVVASGMARGVDAAAHAGALGAAAGRTLAVLASGPDVPTPRQHGTLQRRVRDHGLLVTEFLPGEAARPFHFPRRNRVLAGLSLAVVVVEAGEGSGALITADHAVDLGLDVMAVPGPVGRATSDGTNRLLHEGAAVVRDVEDVLAELAVPLRRWPGFADAEAVASPTASPPPALEGDPLEVWRALADEGTGLDDVCAWTGLPAGRAAAALVELEVRGAALQLAGSRYRRSAVGAGMAG